MKNSTVIPGGYDSATSEFELKFWENYGGVEKFDIHLPIYDQAFDLSHLNYSDEKILDIGSGAVSVFEALVPETTEVTPYDLLADEYNRIAPDKKFPIKKAIDDDSSFSLITLFNMIDHVIKPEEVLNFALNHLEPDGRVFLSVHLYQPHGPVGHPQNYNYTSIIDSLSAIFEINSCDIIREGIPVPYMWFGILGIKSSKSNNWEKITGFKLKCGMKYYYYQTQRILAKSMKIIGLRNILPQQWSKF